MNIQRASNIIATISMLGITNIAAAAVTINFDDVATGTIITDQYASSGVIFSIEGGGALPITSALAGEVISSPNALTNDTDRIASPNHSIRADFVTPVDGSSPAKTDLVSFTYISDDVGSGRMLAFDIHGTLLDEAVSFIGGNQEEMLMVQASGISYVIIDPDRDILVDNFTFNEPSPIPLPAAMWLFGSGLIGLISLARRKKS